MQTTDGRSDGHTDSKIPKLCCGGIQISMRSFSEYSSRLFPGVFHNYVFSKRRQLQHSYWLTKRINSFSSKSDTSSEPTGFHSVILPFNPWEHIRKVILFTWICMKNLRSIKIKLNSSSWKIFLVTTKMDAHSNGMTTCALYTYGIFLARNLDSYVTDQLVSNSWCRPVLTAVRITCIVHSPRCT
jgi:hypothetical protein